MEQEALVREFIATAQTLVGKPCWGIAAGANTGSVLNLHLGGKICRPRLLPNPALSADLRQYRGELSVFIKCAWRLDMEDKIICGWIESCSEGGPLARGLHRVLDETVERISLQRPALDLGVHFSNGCVLRLFCDQTYEEEEESSNYVLFTPKYYYDVACKSQVRRKNRSEPE